MIATIGKIFQIPKEIKTAALNHYLRKCCALQTIAFFQWRRMFTSNMSMKNAKIVDRLITKRIELLYWKSSFNTEFLINADIEIQKKPEKTNTSDPK